MGGIDLMTIEGELRVPVATAQLVIELARYSHSSNRTARAGGLAPWRLRQLY